jgi:hypothetical protein
VTGATNNPAISVDLSSTAPTLAKREDGAFTLKCKLGTLEVELKLDAVQVRTLGLLCVHHFPDIEPRYAVTDEAEAYRLPARKLNLLDDR